MKKVKLDEKTIKEICLIGQGEITCAYISVGPDGFTCLKGTNQEGQIKRRLLTGELRAQGDNCDGL